MSLFVELRKQGRLAAKRNPMYEKSKSGKFRMYSMVVFWAGCLIFLGTTLTSTFDDGATKAYHVLNSGLIFVLALGFLIRFPSQKTPSQEIKSHLLLPIGRNRLIDLLLIRSELNGFNLIWLFFFVPFAIISTTKFYDIMGVLTYSTGVWLLMILNNYWLLLCRTLMNERIWWVILSVLVYGIIAAGLFIPEDNLLFDWSIDLGEGFILGHLLTSIGVSATIATLWFINREPMIKLIYSGINKVEDTRVKHVSGYKFLDRHGEIGGYMWLELKILLRNRVCKTALRTVLMVVIALTCILSSTKAYDGQDMKNSTMVYNFMILGILFPSSLMSYEGNYIDGLMSRKESIYILPCAKYALYSIAILIPLILMISAMAIGKLSVLSCIVWATFVAGGIYFCLFQLAVYNNKTVDLNAKTTNHQNMGTGLQNLISGAAFGVPLLMNPVLTTFWGPTVTAWILTAVGAGLILTSRFWLKNVYHRFTKRRYKNMEGFRDSRQ